MKNRMRILHIISSLGAGGAEIYVRDISIQMQLLGHKVCIAYISSASATHNSQEFENDFKSVLDHAEIQYKEIGHECRSKVWLGAYRLRKLIAEFQPDVIHAHLYYSLIFLAFSGIKQPIVYTHHSQLIRKKFLFYFFNLFVNRYIGISKDCAKILQTAANRNVQTIYNGVSYNRLIVKDTFNKDNNTLNIIAIGNLFNYKNHHLMIESIALFFNKYNFIDNKIIFKIAGEGELKEEIQQKINNTNLQEKVLLLGNRKDIGQLLFNADIFLLSSDTEGLPISLLEALMTGLPAIVTDVGGCRDVVDGCNAGIVVPPKNSTAFAEALNLMIINTSKRLEWSENAKHNAKKFDISIAVTSHLDVYHSLKKK